MSHGGENLSLRKIFLRAGLDLKVSRVKRTFGDDNTRFNVEQLHRFMREAEAGGSGWRATALIVPKIEFLAGGTLYEPRGLMFDTGGGNLDGPEREGCAISYSLAGSDPKGFLRTVAHEIGHVFNLLHSSGSGTTIMYTTDVLKEEGDFPSNIAFRFEESDVQWLREADEELVRPGGSEFRGPQLPMDARQVRGLSLELSLRWERYSVGEPVRLRYALDNRAAQAIEVAVAPTTWSGGVRVTASCPDHGEFELRPPFYACDGLDRIELGPERKLLWSELLPADPRLDGVGDYNIRATVPVKTSDGSVVLESTVQLARRPRPTNSGDLTRQLLRPWLRRVLAHSAVASSTNEGRRAAELIRLYPDARELHELRLCVAAGAIAPKEHSLRQPAAEIPDEHLDKEQRLQRALLRRDQSFQLAEAQELSSELGHPADWIERTLQRMAER